MNDLSLLHEKLDLIAANLNVYKVEQVAAVIRRTYERSDGAVVELIDFYPPWNRTGTFGAYKIASEYMDEDWQRQRFEKYAGVRIADLPMIEAQQAIQRRNGRAHKAEREVAPFLLMLIPQKDDNGNYDKTLIRRYMPLPGRPAARPAQPPPPPPTAVDAPPPPPSAPTSEFPPPALPKQVSKATAGTPMPDEWFSRAAAANDPLDFDVCAARAIVQSGGSAYFETTKHAERARVGLFGEWQPGKAAAYITGLSRYVATRCKLQTDGVENGEVFEQAKEAALEAFREVSG